MLNIILILTILPATTFQLSLDEIKQKGCKYKTISQDLNAPVILAAVFPIQHYRGGRFSINTHAMAYVESFLYAIDEINKNDTILPDTKLGFDIRNSCNDKELALTHALNFMLNTSYLRDMTNNAKVTIQNNTMCLCRQETQSIVAAVVGGYSSPVSKIMADILGVDYIPQVSYASTSPSLGNAAIYRSFIRTIPSELHQTDAIVDLLYHFNWTYVSALASDDDYGRQALDRLREAMKVKGMCLAIDRTFDARLPVDDVPKLIVQLKKVITVSNVVVLWCDITQALSIMEAAYKNDLNITWIATAHWGDDQLLRKKDNIAYTKGVINVKLKDFNVPNFINYFTRDMVYYSNFSNPWLPILWERLYICPPTDPKPPFCFNTKSPGESIPKTKHENVMSAVYAIAHGLHKLFKCGYYSSKHKCPDKHKIIDYKELLVNIKSTQFTIPSSDREFNFNKDGDISYSSYEFRILEQVGKKGQMKKIGTWNGVTRKITISESLTWQTNIPPIAVCSHPCKPGFYVIYSSVSCCWKCLKCQLDQISMRPNSKDCTQCSEIQISDKNHTKCITLDQQNLSIYTSSGIALCVASLLGVLATLFVLFVFIKNWNTPVVKSSSREMSVIQLFSILFLFCLPTLYYVDLQPGLCAAQITFFGTLYSQIIAFIVIKTYRLLRVFRKKKFSKISKYLQNRYQVLLSFVLVLLELIALLVWFLQNKPRIMTERNRTNNSFVLHCGEEEDLLLFGVIGYIFFLSLISGFMAFRARRLPQNFNEGQFIWFAMFTTCLAWLLLVPLYLSLDRARKPLVFMAVNLVCNSALLLILYGYKISIILFYPELNTKDYFRKMAANVTVTTYLRDVDPTNPADKRQREHSVISFDFQSMFDSYRKRQNNSFSLPTRKMTLKQFPSLKRLRSKYGSQKKDNTTDIKDKNKEKRKELKNRTKTLQYLKSNNTGELQKSVSLDDIKIYRESVNINEDIQLNFNKNIEHLQTNISNDKPKVHKVVVLQHSGSINSDILNPSTTNSMTGLIINDKNKKSLNEPHISQDAISGVSIDTIIPTKSETYL